MTWEEQIIVTVNYNLLSFYWAGINFCHVSGRGFHPSDVTHWCHRLLLSHSGALSICANILHLYRFLLQKYICATLFFAHLFEHYVASIFALVPTLQRKSHIYIYIPEKELCGLSPNSQFPHSSVCERFIYSQDLQQNRQTGRGIYKSLTDTWMWKLGLTPHNSYSGNICSEYSVLCPSGIIYCEKREL